LINLLVVNTGRMLASRLSEGAETCLIVDECHRTGSVINARALHGKHAAALGLSATPEREYDEGFQQFISPVLGDVIYEYDYSRASQDGVISQFRLVNVRVDMLPDEKCAFDRLSRQAAKEPLARIAQLSIETTLADMPAAQQAATLNAKFGLPDADCFAAALAVSRFAT
jgi:superfamily II DNA or RNA helicase